MLVASAVRVSMSLVSRRGDVSCGLATVLADHIVSFAEIASRTAASGDLVPQAMRRQEIVGEGVPQRHRLDLDQAAHRHEPEALGLEMTIEPPDDPAGAADRLTRFRCPPAAAFPGPV